MTSFFEKVYTVQIPSFLAKTHPCLFILLTPQLMYKLGHKI